MIKNRSFTILIFLLISGFSFSQNLSKELLSLARQMEGNYNTTGQSKLDTGYFDIRLHMKRIWNNRTDGIWFYVEQAAAKSQDKPYRQRVYRLNEVGYNLFESEIFEIKDPLRFVGQWKNNNAWADHGDDILISKTGCAVQLKKVGKNTYSGSTDSKKCFSGWRGAKYATSIITIIKSGMITWDRGFDENDNYVWGVEKSGYFFKKE
ncbi:MAG: chromophore lyase CpcT/CpeT [Saprospiraceae bacterium]|nr:chromophore lyase CpcT/CpeT [Saprospiraceae bacterium]